MSELELPDMVWQHNVNQQWITYTCKEMDIINKAVQRCRKTVSLPNNGKRKNIVLHLDKMFQGDKVSLRTERVRCLVRCGSFCSWVWFHDDEGEWVSFTPRLVCFLEIAYRKKVKLVKFYENGDFKINLETFEQIEEGTDHVITVSRHTVSQRKVDLELGTKCSSFQSLCLHVDISFEKRLMNLPSMSSSVLNASCSSEQINVSSCSIATYAEDGMEPLKEDINLPVDADCSERENYHIFRDESVIYSATLVFVSIASNSNKFCILQILEHNTKKLFAVWVRNGRLGFKGISELNKHDNVVTAKDEFEKRFFEKTKNVWQEKKSFIHFPGKYDILDIDWNAKIPEPPEVVNLDFPTTSLMDMISDRDTIERIMSSLFYCHEYAPLGHLTITQIKKGYSALKRITDVSSRDVGCELISVCDEFYSKIPHNFGKKCPSIIQTQDDVKEKLSLLESLWNLRVAMVHPINKYYDSFCCTLEVLDFESVEYEVLNRSLQQTHSSTHSSYTMNVTDVFKCHPKNDSFRISNNCRLLWHGSRLTNWMGILTNGLHIAPEEAPSTGSMFGKGLYFADVSSKSANYCFATKKESRGLLLLCEVSLGNVFEVDNGNFDFPKDLPPSFDSVFCRGRSYPQNFEKTVLSDVAVVPFGPFANDYNVNSPLQYNEYVVYSTDLVRMKYLVRLNFSFT